MVDPLLSVVIQGDHYTGYVVIDSFYNNTSSGGVRITPDLDLEEVQDLAHEMTLKFSLFGLKKGGAKAGLRLESQLAPAVRARALEDFGRRIAPLIGNGIYNPGMDMNCGPRDLQAIYRGAGITLGEVTDSSLYTALSVASAIGAGCRSLQAKNDGRMTLAIEGFGSVARHLAECLPKEHYRVLSVATIAGAVRDSRGYDLEFLARMRDQHGDEFVRRIQGEAVSRDDVLTDDVDVLLPGSRTRAITAELAARIRARMIVPIANAPYAPATVPALQKRGVVCLPGYVTNVGGVLGSSLFDSGVPRETVTRMFEHEFASVVEALIESSRRSGTSPCEIAESLAGPSRMGHPDSSSLGRKVYQRYLRKRLPRSVRGRIALRTCRRTLHALVEQLSAPSN